jgi:DNA-binding CsgD family transcriptional regulator
VARGHRRRPVHCPELTELQLEILRLVAARDSNGSIGRQLHISEYTVKTHLVRIRRLLGATDRAHAVARRYETGLLP